MARSPDVLWLPVFGEYSDRYTGRGAVHMHTDWSDGLITVDQLLEDTAANNLHEIIIMEHDTICGAWDARERAAQLGYRFKVTLGVEGTNDLGTHMGAVNIESPLPARAPVQVFNRIVHERGGNTFVPHPGADSYSLTKEEVLAVNRREDPAEHFDWVEIFNAAAQTAWNWNQQYGHHLPNIIRRQLPDHDPGQDALEFYQKNKQLFIGVVAAPDSHTKKAVGDVVILYPWEKGLVRSLQEQDMYIMRKEQLTPVTPAESIQISIRHLKHQRRVRRQANDIIVYKG